MTTPGQTRESRQTRAVRDPEGAASIMFTDRRLTDLALGRTGLAVDVLRLGDEGVALGRVISDGHEIALEDPENVTLLLPVDGRIMVQARAGDTGFGRGSLMLAQAEKRRTRVIAPVGGTFRAATVQISRNRLVALRGAQSDDRRVGLDQDIRAITTPLGRQVAQLLPGLADDVFRQPDRFLTPRALAEFVSLIDDLMVDCIGMGRAETRLLGGLRDFRRVSQACDILQARSGEAISIAVLAAELGVSPRSLQLSFQAVHGVSPRQYLERVRLERVHALIRSPGGASSVTMAALECGFAHLGRFSLAYRRAYGELPSQTRAGFQGPTGRTVSHSG